MSMMKYRVNVGDHIPDFEFTDHDGNQLKSSDFIGGPLVLYFYPKDDTPGCTKEACSFRDEIEELNELEALVIGVSPDSTFSHERFSEKYFLNFTLLSDAQFILCKAFDVLHDHVVERTTFVIDAKGTITWIERPVNVEGHVERVIQAVQNMS